MVYIFLAASGLAAAGNLFLLTVVTDILMWVALAAALNIIMGYAGYVSFGHVVFMGLGGYLTVLAMEYWLHGLAILGSAALAAAVAGAVGLAVLKLRGAFFAIATIGFDLTALYLATMLPTEEGGGEVYFSVRPSLATSLR